MPKQATKSVETVTDTSEVPVFAEMPAERFAVKDEGSANWLVRKLVEADAHIRRVEEQADREIRRTQRDRDFLLARFGPQLEEWAKRELDQRKSLLLLSGTVGFRTVRPKLIVQNEAAALTWARASCPAAIVVTTKLSKTILSVHLSTTGELPGGTTVLPAEERLYVK